MARTCAKGYNIFYDKNVCIKDVFCIFFHAIMPESMRVERWGGGEVQGFFYNIEGLYLPTPFLPLQNFPSHVHLIMACKAMARLSGPVPNLRRCSWTVPTFLLMQWTYCIVLVHTTCGPTRWCPIYLGHCLILSCKSRKQKHWEAWS